MKTVYLVIREPGRRWVPDQPFEAQPDFSAHAAFMDALFESGHLLFGGPLPDTPGRFVSIIAAGSRGDVFGLLCQDPWTAGDVLKVAAVHAWEWTLNVGATRDRVKRPPARSAAR